MRFLRKINGITRSDGIKNSIDERTENNTKRKINREKTIELA